MTRYRRVPTEMLLRESPEESIGVAVPIAISERLDALIHLVEELGAGRPTRKEVISALILGCSPAGAELESALRRYRIARVRDAALGSRGLTAFIDLAPRRPGPRPSRGRTKRRGT